MSSNAFEFTDATKEQSFARIALIGPPGAGKTYSAMAIMQGLLAEGDQLAVIDTERGSAAKYSKKFKFKKLELPTFSPDTYVRAIESAAARGFPGLIIDSLSHAWMGKDGALEQVDRRAGSSHGGSFGAWREVTPMHNRLVEAMLTYPGHLIVTIRVKTEYALEEVVKGGRKTVAPTKIGLAPVQRDGLEYEFDVVADLDINHWLRVSKTRCDDVDGVQVEKPGREFGATLRAWLTDGEPAAPRPAHQATSTGTGKLPPATQKSAAAPAAPASPPPPFDLAAIRGRISMAETRDEAIAIAAAAGIDAQPDEVKAQVRIAIRARANEIDAERSAPSATAPAATAPATTGAAPAPVSAPADAAPAATAPPTADADDPSADPGFRAFCADIQSATGEDTAAWTVTDAIVAWDAAVHFAKDRPQLEELCLAWVASSMKRGGPVMLGLRTKINSDYKAARAALAEPAPRAAGAAA